MEHRAYLPIIGLIICLGEMNIISISAKYGKTIWFSILIIVVLMGIKSFSYAAIFENGHS